MLAKDNPQVEKLLGKKAPLIFRFVINCCAADASPLAVLLDGCDVGSLANDAWIEASGTFRIKNTGMYELLILEDAEVRETETPEQPYLYVQWGVF